MKRLWRRKMEHGKHRTDQEVEESRDRLKETEGRWREVRQASLHLEKLIQEALRGGSA